MPPPVIPVVFPLTLSSTDPVCLVESARLLADRIVELRQQMAKLLGVPLDTPITQALNFGAGLMGTRRQRSRYVDAAHFQLVADEVMTQSPSPGFVVHRNPAAITCDLGVPGPAVNGRDQVGVFAANAFIHFYWIYNGTVLGSLASTTAPYPGPGPVLPTGYFLGAYAGAMLLDASANLVPANIQGRWTLFKAERQVAPATTYGPGTLQSLSLTSCVPSNAEAVRVTVNLIGSAVNGAGTFTARLFDGLDGFAGEVLAVSEGTGAVQPRMGSSGNIEALQSGQLLKVTVSPAIGAMTPVVTIKVIGFENANSG